ncbi:uncharacterized protein [Procambarus clarkii]|uniref:uncharacterized protein isoform X2 n=1 Tax=Procambarus clarkii TaxID=6728 RepID=UPI0037447755
MSRSQDTSHEVKYVYDLPYTERKLLCNILDSNYDWEKLGGKYMGLKWCELEEFRRAERCGESPTNRLLQVWGQQNHTVTELFWLLWKMDHFQAMRALKSCVPEKYHTLFTNAERRTTEIINKPQLVGGIVRRETQEPKRTLRLSSENAQSPAIQTSPGFTENSSTLGAASLPSRADFILEAAARSIQSHSEQQTSNPPISRLQPQSPREDSDGRTEGACALVAPAHNYKSHNFNRGESHSNSYVTSPKIPVTFLYPTATTHTTSNTRPPLAEIMQPRIENNNSREMDSFRKINNNEITCGVPSCEDNNIEELQTRPKAQYDPQKDYLEKLEEKRAKEAARESRGKEAIKHTNSSGGASLAVSDHPKTVPPLTNLQGTPVEYPGGERHRRISSASDTSSHSTSVPVIPYKELEEATALWSRDHLLGRGGFGCVFKGTWKNTEVAVKRIEPHGNASLDNTRLHISQSLEELKLLQSYRHDNILQVYGYSTDHELSPCLVYQFMPNGSVEDRLQCRKIEAFGEGSPLGATTPLTWWQRFRIAWGTARALQFLHTVKEKPLIHGDVKSANILLDQNYEPKLGDFGLAREGKSQSTSMKVSRVHGTKPYLPADYLRSKKLSVKVDTYSYGVVLFELCTGLRAYDEKRKEGGKFLKDLVDDTTDEELLRDRNAGIGHDGEVFTFLYKLGKDCVQQTAGKRPDMTTVFKELESYGLVLDERARARRISQGETSSISPSPRLLQMHYDTAGSLQSPSPSTQPSLPHFFNPSPSPSAASMLPPYSPPSSIPPRSPVPPGLSPNVHLPPYYPACQGVHADVPRLVANGPVAYRPRILPYGGAAAWKQGTGGNIVYGMDHLQPSGSPFHMPHINVGPVMTNGVESRDPPSYSEATCRPPHNGAVGVAGCAPPMIPQFSRLGVNDDHDSRNSTESCHTDSDYGCSESSSVANTTQNVGMANGSRIFRQGAVVDTRLPTVIPTVIPQHESNSSRDNPAAPFPLLTELGMSNHTEMPTAAKKEYKLFG